MNRKPDWWIHRIVSFIGGYAGLYTIMIRTNLGAAQTLNMLEVVKGFLGRNYAECMVHLTGAILYAGAIFGVTLLSKKSRIDMKLFSMAINTAGFIILGFLPENINSYIGLYPVFIMMSVQWLVFGGLNGYNSSPIFSTNNLRQMISAIAEYTCDHKPEQLDKAKYFGGTLICFHTGAAVGYFVCENIGIYASFLGIIPCLIVSAIEIFQKVHTNAVEKIKFMHKNVS
jgi:uncharacterized membrane protein YoaK (UPF0700 family)